MLPPTVPGLKQARVRLAHEIDEPSSGHNHALVVVLAVRGQVLWGGGGGRRGVELVSGEMSRRKKVEKI